MNPNLSKTAKLQLLHFYLSLSNHDASIVNYKRMGLAELGIPGELIEEWCREPELVNDDDLKDVSQQMLRDRKERRGPKG